MHIKEYKNITDINHDKNLYRSPPHPPPPSFPSFPSSPPPHFHWCLGDASPKLHWCSPMHRRSIADISPTISTNNQQLSPNVWRTLDYIGDALANIRQTIASQFFHRNCWYLCSKSQGIGKHRVYNYTFHHRRCKNPQWDRGITFQELCLNHHYYFFKLPLLCHWYNNLCYSLS